MRLKQPYPFYFDSIGRLFRITVILIFVVTLFLVLFQPFNVNYAEHRFPYPVIALIFGITDGLVFFVSVLVIRSLFPNYASEKNWTIFKELGLWAIVLFCIGFANFLLREFIYTNPDNFSIGYLAEEIAHSYLIGLLLVTLLTLINFALLLTSTSSKATGWDQLIHNLNHSRSQPLSQTVTIRAESEQDCFTFDLANLLYVQVDGNYVEYYLRDEQGGAVRHIKRNTLKSVEEQLQPYSSTLRVHRSYLVNLDHVTSVTGNAQGYRLALEGTDSVIPVSRSYIPAFDAVMNR